MTNLYMFDDVNVGLIPWDAKIIAYYADGTYANGNAIRARFPHATLVSIAVRASDDAEALDVEPYDATIADVYNWLKRQLARGVWRPVLYISGGRVDQMMLTMNANGFKRSEYRIWSAHYTGTPHVCGPHSCGVTREQCDWTQYTNTADSSSLDESLLTDEPVFTAPKPNPDPDPVPDAQDKPKPAPDPDPKPDAQDPKPKPPVPGPKPVITTMSQAEDALAVLTRYVAERR